MLNHFGDDNFSPHPPIKLTPEEMSKVYDDFVIVSLDIIPVIFTPHGTEILLGRRKISEPISWWTVGETLPPGNSPAKTIQEILKKELGLEWSIEKIEGKMFYICTNSCVFATRSQPPIGHGRHCLVLVFALEMEEQDIEKIVNSNKKYSEMKWFFISKIDESFDPVIQATVRSLKLKLDTG